MNGEIGRLCVQPNNEDELNETAEGAGGKRPRSAHDTGKDRGTQGASIALKLRCCCAWRDSDHVRYRINKPRLYVMRREISLMLCRIRGQQLEVRVLLHV